MIAARQVAGLLSIAVAACASAPSPQVSTASAPVGAPSRQLDPAAPPRVETPTYMAELTSGSERVTLTLEGRGAFHLNLEFPLKIELGGADAAVLGKKSLTLADATERSETRLRVGSDVQWQAPGDHWLGARVQFATCTPDSCTPHEVSLATKVLIER